MIRRIRQLGIKQKIWLLAAVLLGSAAVLAAAVRYTNRTPAVPMFDVKREEFIDSLQFRGEVKALKSAIISAPAETGDLQILTISADSTQVKPGDAVVEFDKTKTEQDLAQFRSTLKSAQAEADQARAQARLTEGEDTTAITKARYDVEAAKLDASKEEILSKIEGEEAKLKLADAEQKLHEAEEKLKSDQALDRATIESKISAGKKADFDAQRAEHALAKMTVRAPTAGMVTLLPNWNTEDNAPFKPGDHAWPGAGIAELPDVSTLRVAARVDETERGRLAVKQSVTLQLDAIPDRQFTGSVDQISTIASMDLSGGWPIRRNFSLEITIDQQDARLKPGMTAQVTVVLDRVSNALTIPVQASFEKSGQTVAYVWSGSKFEEHPIEVARRSGDRLLIAKGLQVGDRIAMKDPSAKE